jgi:multidrug efflux pump subunit AcrA (membrane-fusion protein)
VLDVLFGAVIVASGAVAVMASTSSALTTSAPNTGTVTRGTVQATESTSGNVVAATTYSLGFPTAGTIVAIDVSVGQQVVQGQVLAAIGATAAQSALAVAQDNLTAAQDRLAQDEQGGTSPAQGSAGAPSAEAVLTPAGARRSGGADSSGGGVSGSGETVSSTPTSTPLPNPATIAADEAVVAADEQVVNTAQQDLSGTTLIAPANGTITAIDGLVGQTVGSGGNSTAEKSSGGAGSTVSGASANAGAAKSSAVGGSFAGASSGGFMTLANLSELDVTCDVAEANVTAILQGQSATVSLNALPGREFVATVASVAQVGTPSGGVVTFPVTLALQNPTSAVKPGMSATVTIVTSSVDNVLAVPSSAVHSTGKTGVVTVRSARGVDSRVTVVIGLAGTSTTAVYGDLSVGETVVLPSVSISVPATGAITRRAARTLGGGLGGLGGHTGRLGGSGKPGRRG